MAIHIIVCVKQVIDPDTPSTSLSIDKESKTMVGPSGISPVVNGFDENALEAALRFKDKDPDTKITAITAGSEFQMDVIKKPLSMGCDQLILLQDTLFSNLDAYSTATVLASAIRKLGEFNLILCGRQASDFDQAHVPLGIAEFLNLPCVTVTKNVSLENNKIISEKTLPDGYDIVECPAPAVITVSNELGNPRYPNLKNIMAAARTKPEVWSSDDLKLDKNQLEKKSEIIELFIPSIAKMCELMEGEDDAEKGENLFHKLKEQKFI